MHWHIYLVVAVGVLCVLILDLVMGLWSRAAMSFLMFVTVAIMAWNRRDNERKARAAESDARAPDASHE